MVERLLTALRSLAAPAPEQRRIGGDVAPVNELALEYADAWLTARQCPGLEFTSGQTELLDELEGKLESLTHLEPLAAVEGVEAPEMKAIRALARRALLSLGQSMEPPAHFPPGRIPP